MCPLKLELCTDSLEGVKLAIEGAADRVELCAALDSGGLSPSPSLLRSCLRAGDVPIHCMLRPRPGGFVYSKVEMDWMQDELLQFKENGAAGVVFGCLNAVHEVDEANTQILTEHAHSLGLEATFHRAFDHLKNFQKGLDQLIEIGVDRILTSGGERTVEEGLGLIRSLVDHSRGRIQIMAGSGVSKENAQSIASAGVDALHLTSHKKCEEDGLLEGMGHCYTPDPAKWFGIKTLFS